MLDNIANPLPFAGYNARPLRATLRDAPRAVVIGRTVKASPSTEFDDALVVLRARDFAEIARGAGRVAFQPAYWLGDAEAQVVRLRADALVEGIAVPSDETIGHAHHVLSICSRFPISEPALAHDDEGGFEIFCKEGDVALLLAIRASHVLQVFGDSTSEQWRGRYSLQGDAWIRHLDRFLTDLTRE